MDGVCRVKSFLLRRYVNIMCNVYLSKVFKFFAQKACLMESTLYMVGANFATCHYSFSMAEHSNALEFCSQSETPGRRTLVRRGQCLGEG